MPILNLRYFLCNEKNWFLIEIAHLHYPWKKPYKIKTSILPKWRYELNAAAGTSYRRANALRLINAMNSTVLRFLNKGDYDGPVKNADGPVN